MKAGFRVDASVDIGTGHVMRCLTLADRLREKGAEVFFICRELTGNLNEWIEKQGFAVHRLNNPNYYPEKIDPITNHSHWLGVHWETDVHETLAILEKQAKIDWLIIDHYGIDRHWEEKVKPLVKNIMVIDDLADRNHVCHILLDQNFYKNYRNRYNRLVSNHCLKLLGPQYAILRPEFLNAQPACKNRDGKIKRIFIFFGGVDLTNETSKALEAIQLLKRDDIKVDVVVGSACPHKDQIASICSTLPNITFFCQVNHIAKIMGKADLAIGAGGTTTWERLYLGLPAITIVTAKNQAEILSSLHDIGAVWNLGSSENVTALDISLKLKCAITHPELVRKMSQIGKAIIGYNEKGENTLLCKLLEADHDFN